MKSREFKTIYLPSLGRYVYEHRGNGLIVDNIMKPLKGNNNHLNAMVTLHISTAWPNLHACAQQGTRRVAAMDSCFVLVRTHQHGIAMRKGIIGSFKPQLTITHMGAVLGL